MNEFDSMNSTSRRVLNTFNTLHNQSEPSRLYNCYSDVYRVQNIHVRGEPFPKTTATPKQKHFPTAQLETVNPEEEEQEKESKSVDFNNHQSSQQQPQQQQLLRDESGSLASASAQASVSGRSQNQIDNDNIYVQYQLGLRQINNQQQQQQQNANTRKQNLLQPSSSVSDMQSDIMYSSNRATPKNIGHSKDSISGSLHSTAEKNKQRKPWGSRQVPPNGNGNSSQKKNKKPQQIQQQQSQNQDERDQYPPRELSIYSAGLEQLAISQPKHIYLSLNGSSQTPTAAATATIPTLFSSKTQPPANTTKTEAHTNGGKDNNEQNFYQSKAETEELVRQKNAKILSLQGSAEKAKVVESILSAKKSSIEIREKKRKPTEGSEESTATKQIQAPEPLTLYKPTFISESNIYLIEQKKYEGTLNASNPTSSNELLSQKQSQQQQQQQQLQNQFQSMPQSPSSGYVKGSMVMFPSMDSLVNSAKERQNYDFIAGSNERTITIRSKENSFNLATSQQLQFGATSASKGGALGTSVFSSNRSIVESDAYRAQAKSPECRSPKTQLTDAQFMGKETMQERNEFWVQHTQQHKHLLGEHYIAQEMRECTFSPTFFTNNTSKKASVSHKNLSERVDQSLDPNFHREMQEVKKSYAQLHLFKKGNGYSVATN